MNKLTFSALTCAVVGLLIEVPLVSAAFLIYSSGAFMFSAVKDFKKARAMHSELKKSKN